MQRSLERIRESSCNRLRECSVWSRDSSSLNVVGGVVERMSEHRWSWTSRKKLPSRIGCAHPAHGGNPRGARTARLGWDGRDYFGVEMALEESLTNAIRHGNRLDESKQVLVECKVSPERFWLRVTDEGPRLPTASRARLHRRRKPGMPRRPRPGAHPGLHDARRIQPVRQLRHDGKNPHGIVSLSATLPPLRAQPTPRQNMILPIPCSSVGRASGC